MLDYSRIDLAMLDRWPEGRLPGYRGDPRRVLLSGGQSTPTYRLESGGSSWVLRNAAGTAVYRDAVVFGEMAEPTADYAWRFAADRLGAD